MSSANSIASFFDSSSLKPTTSRDCGVASRGGAVFSTVVTAMVPVFDLVVDQSRFTFVNTLYRRYILAPSFLGFEPASLRP